MGVSPVGTEAFCWCYFLRNKISHKEIIMDQISRTLSNEIRTLFSYWETEGIYSKMLSSTERDPPHRQRVLYVQSLINMSRSVVWETWCVCTCVHVWICMHVHTISVRLLKIHLMLTRCWATSWAFVFRNENRHAQCPEELTESCQGLVYVRGLLMTQTETCMKHSSVSVRYLIRFLSEIYLA